MLGTWMRRRQPSGVDVVGLRHATPVSGPSVTGDVTDPQAIWSLVEEVAPDLIVHLAYRIDRDSIVASTANLAATGRPIVLASTDAVFAGDQRVRGETDQPDPVWDYGRWKVEAERVALEAGGVVVRLPLMCSFDPDDATTAAIRGAAVGAGDPGWYRDEVRMPAWAEDVAEGLWRITAVGHRDGIWHLMGADPMTRPELASALACHLGLPGCGRAIPSPPADTRPRTLLLSDGRARHEIEWRPKSVRI